MAINDRLVLVSSWTDGQHGAGGNGGVHTYRMSAGGEEWQHVETYDAHLNVGFVAFDPQRDIAYVLDERKDIVGGTGGGFVHSYAFDMETARLSHLTTVSSVGPNPSYVSVDPRGRYVFVANHGNAHHAAVRVHWDGEAHVASNRMLYDDGSVAMLPVRPGGLERLSHLEVLKAEPARSPTHQRSSHPHSALLDPSGRWLVVCDKGTDRISTFRLHEDGRLSPAASIRSEPGHAPRHPVFHPGTGLLYVVNELHCSVDVFALDDKDGSLRHVHAAPTVPFRDPGDTHPSDLAFHPGGGFLYVSNRGDDSVCVLAVDVGTGKPEPLQLANTAGGRPRGLTVDPDGDAVYVACTDAGLVAVHGIDPATGTLLPEYRTVPVPRPTCIRFAPAKQTEGYLR